MNVKNLIDKIDNVIPKAFQGKLLPDSARFSISVYVVGNLPPANSGLFGIIKNVHYDKADDSIVIEVGPEV